MHSVQSNVLFWVNLRNTLKQLWKIIVGIKPPACDAQADNSDLYRQAEVPSCGRKLSVDSFFDGCFKV